MTIHFICRGNVQRSVIAESYLKSLRLPGIETLSSGAIADATRAENDRLGFSDNTRRLLARHGLAAYTKSSAEQLTQDRITDDQLVICANQIAYDEAAAIVTLPKTTTVWDIVDIGEGTRIANTNDERVAYEEEIFNEITALIDQLVIEKQLA